MQLAAHCRGNVGTARSYWRQRLRLVDAEAAGEAELAAATPESDAAATQIVWVAESLQEPAAPVEADEGTALVLHARLLHNGLSEELLPRLLPLEAHCCLAILMRLQGLGIARLQDARWQVDPLGYALVRDLLRSRDYLTDDF